MISCHRIEKSEGKFVEAAENDDQLKWVYCIFSLYSTLGGFFDFSQMGFSVLLAGGRKKREKAAEEERERRQTERQKREEREREHGEGLLCNSG